ELFGNSHLGGHFALVPRNQRTIPADHVAHREQPAIGRDHSQKICRKPCEVDLGENCRKRLELLVSIENGTAYQPVEISAAGNECIELIEILLDGVDGFALERKLEQGGGVATSHAGDDGIFACQGNARRYYIHSPDAVAKGGANYWNSRWNSDLR